MRPLDYWTMIAPTTLARALRLVVISLCRPQECFCILNPWIISVPRKSSQPEDILSPLYTCIGYAIVEPLLTWTSQRGGLEPWILVLCLSPIHIFSGLISYLYASEYPDDPILSIDAPRQGPGSILLVPKMPKRRRYQVVFALYLLPMVVTAALLDSSLLLLGQSLYSTKLRERHYLLYFLILYAIILQLGCRYVDYEVSRRTRRNYLRDYAIPRALTVAMVCMILLFVLRLTLRWIIGTNPFLAFYIPDPIEADTLYVHDS